MHSATPQYLRNATPVRFVEDATIFQSCKVSSDSIQGHACPKRLKDSCIFNDTVGTVLHMTKLKVEIILGEEVVASVAVSDAVHGCSRV